MLLFIFKLFYFMLPAYFANMAPVVFRKYLLFLDIPVDFGKKINNKPIFGRTKTIRGFLVGILSAILVVFLQKTFMDYSFLERISLINYKEFNFIIIGFIFGFGSLFGDLVKSFIKRRIGKSPSESWKIFDQLDYVLGSLLFISVVVSLSIKQVFGVILLSLILTIFTNQISWKMGLRKERW